MDVATGRGVAAGSSMHSIAQARYVVKLRAWPLRRFAHAAKGKRRGKKYSRLLQVTISALRRAAEPPPRRERRRQCYAAAIVCQR